MKNHKYSVVIKYTAAGMLLGLMLVVNGWLLNYQSGFRGRWFHIFDYSPDFAVIILSPLLLSLLFCFIGIKRQQLLVFNEQIKYNLSQEQLISSAADQQVKLLAKVVSQINEAVIIFDKDGCIQWINLGFTAISGYNQAEVAGKKIMQIMHGPLTDKNVESKIAQCFTSGASLVDEILNYKKNGDTYWIRISIKPIYDEAGFITNYIAIESDITQRKITELALKKSEEEKAVVLDNTQTVICLHDMNGIIIDVNVAGEKMSGFSKEEIVGSNLKSLVSPDFQQQFDDYLLEIIQQQRAEGSLQIITKSGQKRAWLFQNTVYDNNGNEPYIIASAIDITESVKAQNEIEKQQQFIRQIIDNSPNIIFVLNDQLQVVLANKTFGEYYNYNPKEMPFAATLSKDENDIFLGDAASLIQLEEGEILRADASIAAPGDSNTLNWFHVVQKTFKEKNGKKYILGFGMDITDRYQVQSDLIAANEMVERSLKVKDHFIANMSHEIRTPLNAVIGFTDILADTHLDDKQEEYVQIVKTASQNLLALVNNILDLSKIESGNIALESQPINIRQLITDAVKILEPKASSKHIELRTNFTGHIPEKVLGDQLRISQILFNLLGNAIKFTDTGYVEVGCKMVQGTDEDKHYISFTLKDTGIGVAEDKQTDIFERFTQANADTQRLYGGTGLGLNIAKSIVDMHGGTLQMESVAGQGTLFHFILPFSKYSASKDTPEIDIINADKMALINAENPIHILLVEDNMINAMLAIQVLNNAGIENILHVENGLEAVQAASNQSFDIVLMDIQMPIMNGIDATKNIRQLDGEVSAIPIVAMTAHTLYGEMQNCYNAGMTGYVSKPFKPENLYTAIVTALNIEPQNNDWIKEFEEAGFI
jgi:PAS domain S-box-containing protein